MKFAAAGDAIIQRRIDESFEGYSEICPYISDADVKFFNLETTLNKEGECYASQFSGGTYIRTNPEVLEDLKRFGFNMTTFNNNHALDFSYEGLYLTLDALDKSGLVHGGVGMNMRDASKPVYIDTEAGRVALIALNTTFDEPMLAGNSSPRVKGRPGINGIRVNKTVTLPEKELCELRRIVDMSAINVQRIIEAKEGYYALPNNDEVFFGPVRCIKGEKADVVYTPHPTDVERIKATIAEAKENSDYLIVSLHSHQLAGEHKETVPKYLEALSHLMIDLGANAIIGHGPHLLRPFEVYKDSPIFYSLGDFILELYDVEFAPADFYEKYGVSTEEPVKELLRVRSKNFTVGLMTDPRMFLSVIPIWETEGSKLVSLKLLPIMGNMGEKDQGLPRICSAKAVIDYLGEMSKPYGISMKETADGLIECEFCK